MDKKRERRKEQRMRHYRTEDRKITADRQIVHWTRRGNEAEKQWKKRAKRVQNKKKEWERL